MTSQDFSIQVVGTFSFLFAVALAAQLIHSRGETGKWPLKWWETGGAFLYFLLMLAWAAAPHKFGPAFPGLENWAVDIVGLALICGGTGVLSLIQKAKARHKVLACIAILAGVWLVTGTIFFGLVGAVYAAAVLS